MTVGHVIDAALNEYEMAVALRDLERRKPIERLAQRSMAYGALKAPPVKERPDR
jgi:hypothetical protein